MFLCNGSADSLVIAELSNWNAKAIKIPRTEVMRCNRDDINGAGVYFLFCKEEGEKNSVYIGESENLKMRLRQHIQENIADREQFYWHTAVMFTSKALNKALIRYLEYRLVEAANEARRYTVLTKNIYSKTIIKESSLAIMEEFLDNIKILINALGYKVLEPIASNEEANYGKLYLAVGKIKAQEIVTTEGFVLLKGSQLNDKTNKSMTAMPEKKPA